MRGASGSRGRVGEGWCGVAPAPECARGGGGGGVGPGGVSSAARCARRLQGADSKQLHVFLYYVFQQIPGFAPRLSLVPFALAVNLSKKKQFVRLKCCEWANVKMRGDLERRVPLVSSVPCPKTDLRSSCSLGHRLSLSP